jgi:hypothetical protein
MPLAANPTDHLPLFGDDGVERGRAWRHAVQWRCSDAELALTILAAEPVDLPGPEPSEPAAGAIARLNRATAAVGGLLLLTNPTQSFGTRRIALATGVRLIAIAGDGDLACWDVLLSRGVPVYGVRGTVAFQAIRPDAYALLSALAYGNYTCEEGLRPTRFEESPTGVEVDADQDLEAIITVREGFEAARLRGRSIRWRDGGSEGYVRLELRGPSGSCWTQPRFVAQPHGHPHGA